MIIRIGSKNHFQFLFNLTLYSTYHCAKINEINIKRATIIISPSRSYTKEIANPIQAFLVRHSVTDP